MKGSLFREMLGMNMHFQMNKKSKQTNGSQCFTMLHVSAEKCVTLVNFNVWNLKKSQPTFPWKKKNRKLTDIYHFVLGF